VDCPPLSSPVAHVSAKLLFETSDCPTARLLPKLACFFEIGSCYVAQAGLAFSILLPQCSVFTSSQVLGL
jgi:hypothetical protein